jgi:hypothetical protein
LKEKVDKYESMTVQWIPGHEPEAWLYTGPEETDFLEKIPMPDADAEELGTLFAAKGFVMKRKGLPEPTKVFSFQGKEYRLYSDLQDYESLQFLVPAPGRILTIESAEEDAFLHSSLEADKHYWLGATDAKEEGVWVWGGAETPFWTKEGGNIGDSYTGWAADEPNNSNPRGAENCAVFGGSGWVDRPCGEQHQLIVELPIAKSGHSQEL